MLLIVRAGLMKSQEFLKVEEGGGKESDAMLLGQNIEEGATSQGICTASRNWKKQRKGFFPRAS